MSRFIFSIFILLFLNSGINAQKKSGEVPLDETTGNQIRIGMAHSTIPEKKATEQLKNLVKSYPIEEWIFSDTVVIDEYSIPHSHPVLTLNAKYLNDDQAQLATFLHEQFHWLASADKKKLDVAIARFEREFPTIPETLPLGARDKYSGYLHLVICDLEFQAMTLLLGERSAREILKNWKHYTWIYDKVLNDKDVRRINLESGFSIKK